MRVTATFLSIAAVVMLLVALLGKPPYAFFANLKLIVVIASIACTIALFNIDKRYALLGIVLLPLSYIEMSAKHSRVEWIPWNSAMVVTLLASILMMNYERLGQRLLRSESQIEKLSSEEDDMPSRTPFKERVVSWFGDNSEAITGSIFILVIAAAVGSYVYGHFFGPKPPPAYVPTAEEIKISGTYRRKGVAEAFRVSFDRKLLEKPEWFLDGKKVTHKGQLEFTDYNLSQVEFNDAEYYPTTLNILCEEMRPDTCYYSLYQEDPERDYDPYER